MAVARAIRRLCTVKRPAVPHAVRRRELIDLAAVVGAALLMQALVLPPVSSGTAWPHALMLMALPWAGAWSLRRSAGRPAAAAAAILSLGLIGGLLVVAPHDWARELTTNAYVSLAMVWILSTDRRASTGTVAAGAVLMALAILVASLI